jgi:peptidoglycan/LPS O-acetylase OafA/YrhL
VASTARWKYQPSLDGLRALAVAAVVAYHLDAGWASGGFLGVDAFFVLSGFLITSLLLTEWDRMRTLSLTAFWARRARRLLPALILVLLAVAAYATWQARPVQLGSLRGDMISTLCYGANWNFIHSGQSYFALFTDASPLRHTWSLAIEEQFYLVWPLVTLACLRLARGRRALLAAVCVVGAIASAVTMARLYDSADPSRAYYGTDARAQLLLIGALLAILLARFRPRRLSAISATHTLGVVGGLYVLWAFTRVADTDAWMYTGGYAVFGLAVAAVIVSVTQPESTPWRRVLSLGPIVWLGRISYGIYLWHWPVIVVVSPDRTGLDGASLTVLRVTLTLVLAALSFYIVELPIRERRALRGRFALVASPAAFAVTAVVVIFATLGAAPLPDYYRASAKKVINSHTIGGQSQPVATRAPRVLLVGDSLAVSLYDGLKQVAFAHGIELSIAAYPGCGMLRGLPALPNGSPMPGYGTACDENVPKLQDETLSSLRPDLVIWLSNWELTDRIVDGNLLQLGAPEADPVFEQLFEQTATRLQATGARLVLLMPAQPVAHGWLPQYGYSSRLKRLPALDQLLAAQAARHPDTTNVIDLVPIVCPGGPPCPEIVNGIRLRPDGSHFAPDGARYVAEQLVPGLVPLLQVAPAPATTPTTPTSTPAAAAERAARPKRSR